MKITFGMIVFQSDFVLKQVLESVYPYAHQILIAEGPVEFWQKQGYQTSTDKTNEILDTFPDPENKFKIVHSKYSEKNEQCNAYMQYLDPESEYLWQIDADEVYKQSDIEKTIKFLQKEKPTSVGVKPYSFYGCFERYIGGYEQATDNFLRIFKVTPGCSWLTHRPPTIKHKQQIERKHINSDQFFDATGVAMYHYSYCFLRQVEMKMKYYEQKVAVFKMIENYFEKVWLPWNHCTALSRSKLEILYEGVHEFQPRFRTPSYTMLFNLQHPESIQKSLSYLKMKQQNELEAYK